MQPQPSVKRTYGRAKGANKSIQGGQLYTPTAALDVPDEENFWAASQSVVRTGSSNSHKVSGLSNRALNQAAGAGASSPRDDDSQHGMKCDISTSSKSNNKDKESSKCSGKRSRCLLPAEVVSNGHPDDIRILSETIQKFNNHSHAHFGVSNALFVTLPDWSTESGKRFVNWLQQLGFYEDTLGSIWGLKYPRENVRQYVNRVFVLYSLRFDSDNCTISIVYTFSAPYCRFRSFLCFLIISLYFFLCYFGFFWLR